MRAEPEPRVATAAERVPCAIALDLEPRFAQPACEELVRRILLPRVADARRADRVELVEALEDALHD